ncbi:hypothetical protein HZ994_16120 [Akkermansiaceae bacterium]|nr:hypothetical protein HZ994_16120 [Akkermansiaceae bacterium]
MKRTSLAAVLLLAFTFLSQAGVSIDEAALGKSLGGWNKQGGKVAEYPLSGADYRTYRPEVSPTPDGGIFISIRIDHVRGWLSSNDHAMLEITVDRAGKVASAQSSIAIQGRSVSSDLIRGGNAAGQQVAGVDRAVQIGTDLIADVSAKMLREKIVEAGRVSFPAALRHNYNLLYQAIVVKEGESTSPPPNPLDTPEAAPAIQPAIPKAKPLDIKPYGTGG